MDGVLLRTEREFFHGLRIVRLDVDKNPGRAQALGVHSIPTLVMFRGGVEVARHVGTILSVWEAGKWIAKALNEGDTNGR